MKSKLLLLISLIFFNIIGFSQNDSKEWDWEWAPIGAVWMYETANMGMESYYSQYWYVRSAKDTVFHGVNCRKLEVERYYWPDFEPVKMTDRFTFQDGGDIYFYNSDIDDFVLSFSYDLQKGDTVEWQMPVFEDCINSFYLDTVLNWDVGYLSGAGTSYMPYSIFMKSNVSLNSYRLITDSAVCFASRIGYYNLSYGHGSYYDYFGVRSDLFDLYSLEELINTCFCYYDGEVKINTASIYLDDTIINAKDSCLNYYNKYSNIPSYETNDDGFSVYPNPFKDAIQISFEEPVKLFTIEIYNITGQLLYSAKKKDDNTHIDLRGFVSGNYLIKIQTKDKVFTQRITKN